MAANYESELLVLVLRAHRIDRSAFPCDNPITESPRCAATPKSTVAWDETPALSPGSISSTVIAPVSLASGSLFHDPRASRYHITRRTSNFVNIFAQIVLNVAIESRVRARARACE